MRGTRPWYAVPSCKTYPSQKTPNTVHLRGTPAVENPPRSFDTYSYVLGCHKQLEVELKTNILTVFLVSYFLVIYYQNSKSYGAGFCLV
jgi:hypothetical protein